MASEKSQPQSSQSDIEDNLQAKGRPFKPGRLNKPDRLQPGGSRHSEQPESKPYLDPESP
jgi:hypothetical protein